MSTTRHKPQLYESPIRLDAARSGSMEIRHRVIPTGDVVEVIGQRQALLRGLTPTRAVTRRPIIVHELVEHGRGIWMTDLPEELNQIYEMLHTVRPSGNVLVGGLGLGVAATIVARLAWTRVLVVERSAHVIRLCKNPSLFDTAKSDIYKFIEAENAPRDAYLLDTWQGTNEATWWEEVMPLRRLIRRKHGVVKVHCWAEDIMLGQIGRSLATVGPHWFYTNLPVPMTPLQARWFVREVGSPQWEKKYGKAIDDYTRQRRRSA